MLPETALTRKGVANMNPLAMNTIMKNGRIAPMFETPVGSPSSAISEFEMPMIVANTPAMKTGYIANEIKAESQRAK